MLDVLSIKKVPKLFSNIELTVRIYVATFIEFVDDKLREVHLIKLFLSESLGLILWYLCIRSSTMKIDRSRPYLRYTYLHCQHNYLGFNHVRAHPFVINAAL